MRIAADIGRSDIDNCPPSELGELVEFCYREIKIVQNEVLAALNEVSTEKVEIGDLNVCECEVAKRLVVGHTPVSVTDVDQQMLVRGTDADLFALDRSEHGDDFAGVGHESLSRVGAAAPTISPTSSSVEVSLPTSATLQPCLRTMTRSANSATCGMT